MVISTSYHRIYQSISIITVLSKKVSGWITTLAGTERAEVVHAERVDTGPLHTWMGMGIKDPGGLERGRAVALQ